jgi:hypothetical protein
MTSLRGIIPLKVCFARDLFRKPVPTFRDHARVQDRRRPARAGAPAIFALASGTARTLEHIPIGSNRDVP